MASECRWPLARWIGAGRPVWGVSWAHVLWGLRDVIFGSLVYTGTRCGEEGQVVG